MATVLTSTLRDIFAALVPDSWARIRRTLSSREFINPEPSALYPNNYLPHDNLTVTPVFDFEFKASFKAACKGQLKTPWCVRLVLQKNNYTYQSDDMRSDLGFIPQYGFTKVDLPEDIYLGEGFSRKEAQYISQRWESGCTFDQLIGTLKKFKHDNPYAPDEALDTANEKLQGAVEGYVTKSLLSCKSYGFISSGRKSCVSLRLSPLRHFLMSA